MGNFNKRISSILLIVFGIFTFSVVFALYSNVLKTVLTSQVTTPPPEVFTTAEITSPLPRAVPTNPLDSCLLWSQVDSTMAGTEKCVYGIIYRVEQDSGGFRIRFENGRQSFFLASGSHSYNVSKSECVYATGIIQLSSENVPYILLDKMLLSCKIWIK